MEVRPPDTLNPTFIQTRPMSHCRTNSLCLSAPQPMGFLNPFGGGAPIRPEAILLKGQGPSMGRPVGRRPLHALALLRPAVINEARVCARRSF